MPLSHEQSAFQNHLVMWGHRCEKCHDPEQAWRIVKDYLQLAP